MVKTGNAESHKVYLKALAVAITESPTNAIPVTALKHFKTP